jgi:succinyl-CoA:acetate CoA-transferase
LWTGASTAPELDGALAKANGIEMRLPYQSDPTCRKLINEGKMLYTDMHLSHVAQSAWFGFLGKLDVAVVEVVGVLPDGSLIPSTSVGNNKTWLDQAQHIILEVNQHQNPALEGMHDIYYGTQLPPHRQPIPLVRSSDRIGETYLGDEIEEPFGNLPNDLPLDANCRNIEISVAEALEEQVVPRPMSPIDYCLM